MSFDPEPATPAPRLRLLHTHRGHTLGLRVAGKPYLVLPSCPAENTPQGRGPENLARAVLKQTGLHVLVSPEYCSTTVNDHRSCLDSVILGGVLRMGAGFFPPSMWLGSPDADVIAEWAMSGSTVVPFTNEQIRVYPHEVVPGDIYNFPIVGTRYERNAHGEESVTFQYENYSGAALGRDDAFGEDGEEAPEQEGAGGRRRKVTERNPSLGCAWGSPHDLRAQILVYRLGGDYRGEST